MGWFAVRVLGSRDEVVGKLIDKVARRKGIRVGVSAGDRKVVISFRGKEKLRLSLRGSREVEVRGERGEVKIAISSGGVRVGDLFISSPGEKIVVGGVEVKIVRESGLPGYLLLFSENAGKLLEVVERVPYAGKKLLPIDEEEARRFLGREERFSRMGRIEEGDYVEVLSGKLKGFRGRVAEITGEKAKLEVEIFGRVEEVELSTFQLKKL